MNEQEILDQIALQGEERAAVLQKIEATVAAWGLKLPAVEPDALHFGHSDFAKVGETEYNVNNNVKDGYCGKFIFMFAGQTCPMHHHRKKHETFFVVKGRVDMLLDGKRHLLEQGHTLVVDRFRKHQFTALEDTLILESSQPDLVDDSIFADGRVNKILFGVERPFEETSAP
jgi:mannose-6-phosphate isomerase-like protein (cupin superfamily)